MAGRIRSIKPEILEDERAARLPSTTWRLWVSMWLLADDHGRLRGGAAWLQSQVFWSDPSGIKVSQVESMLQNLASAQLVSRYVVNDQSYVEIRNWKKHQKIDHPGKPKIPEPSANLSENPRDSREILGDPRETLATDLDQDQDQDQDQEGDQYPRVFDFVSVYLAYPRKEGKKKGLEKCKATIKTHAQYQALLKAVGNYAAKVLSDGTEPKFIKHFDTFMGCWEDFVDYVPPQEFAGERKLKNVSGVSSFPLGEQVVKL